MSVSPCTRPPGTRYYCRSWSGQDSNVMPVVARLRPGPQRRPQLQARRRAGFPSPRVARTTYSRVPSRWVPSRTPVSRASRRAKVPALVVKRAAETHAKAHSRTDGAKSVESKPPRPYPSLPSPVSHLPAMDSVLGARNTPLGLAHGGTRNHSARAFHAESRRRPLTRNHDQHRDVRSIPRTVHLRGKWA